MRPRIPAVTATLLALALAPAAAQARTHVAVGIGDQSTRMFTSPYFSALKVRKTRYFIPWDAMRSAGQVARADDFVDRARAAGVSVLMHVSTNDLRNKRAHLPSSNAYRHYVGLLVAHYRALGVHEFGTWNEANHVSQPTWRSPAAAARYFKLLYGLCRGRCTVVALDVLDQAGVGRYISRFYASLSRGWRSRARLVGIHNYSDTNRFRSSGTSLIIHTARRYNRHARFWMTETGGVVEFGRSFPCSTRRAAKAVKYMFSLARRYRGSVSRLYAYNWTGSDCRTRFDAGLTNADGTLRPGYYAFRTAAASFTR